MDGGDLPPAPVPATTLLAIAATVPLCFAALVTLPARRWAHQPLPAPSLRATSAGRPTHESIEGGRC
jgi:hypothetical protein